jgi:hypothetical protein
MDPRPARDVLLTAAEAGPLLGVEPATIIMWRRRGYLAERGSRATGRRPALLFSWGDLMDCQARHVDIAGQPSANRD